MLRHHRQILHRFPKFRQVKGLPIEPVEIEGLRQLLQQELLHLAQIVFQQKGLFSEEEVEPSRLFVFDLPL